MESEDPYDLWNEPSARQWVTNVIEDMVPKLSGSRFCMSIVPDGTGAEAGDVKYWVELGASICMNKPIILLVMGDRTLPPKLESVADEIVRLPEGLNEDSQHLIAEALERLVKRLDEEEKK